MPWSLTIARPAGIEVRVHVTFLLLLAWAAAGAWIEHESLAAAAASASWVLAVFGIVVLHELGHALMARRFGCQTRDILLLPVGGVARLERMPERPSEELAVALAGPAVNGALALLFGMLATWSGASVWLPLDAPDTAPLLVQLTWINIVLGVFNLVPAFPMDGGRAVRALLAMRLGRRRATRLAAGLGRTLAIAFGFIGLLGNPVLVLIAVFVWFGATAEAHATEVEAALTGLTAGDAMASELRALPVEAPVSLAVDGILAGFQTDFPVVSGTRCVGLLDRRGIVDALSTEGPNAPVAKFMLEGPVTVDHATPATEALTRLNESRQAALPVTRGGALVGMLEPGQVAELLMIEQALGRRAGKLRG